MSRDQSQTAETDESHQLSIDEQEDRLIRSKSDYDKSVDRKIDAINKLLCKPTTSRNACSNSMSNLNNDILKL